MMPRVASIPSQSGEAMDEGSESMRVLSSSNALKSLGGSMLTETPEPSGKVIGIAPALLFSG
jgi:hypothetical protein